MTPMIPMNPIIDLYDVWDEVHVGDTITLLWMSRSFGVAVEVVGFYEDAICVYDALYGKHLTLRRSLRLGPLASRHFWIQYDRFPEEVLSHAFKGDVQFELLYDRAFWRTGVPTQNK